MFKWIMLALAAYWFILGIYWTFAGDSEIETVKSLVYVVGGWVFYLVARVEERWDRENI